MNVEWEVMLSYDAKVEFYQVLIEKYDFDKIKEEAKDFRLSLLALLLDSGASDIESHCKSTIVFKQSFPQGMNPTEYYEGLFSNTFENKNDFSYMMLCTVGQSHYPVYVTNNGLSLHSNSFALDVKEAKALLAKIKKA